MKLEQQSSPAKRQQLHGNDSDNNREATMAVFGFTAGVAFAFGATAYACPLDRLITDDTKES